MFAEKLAQANDYGLCLGAALAVERQTLLNPLWSEDGLYIFLAHRASSSASEASQLSAPFLAFDQPVK